MTITDIGPNFRLNVDVLKLAQEKEKLNKPTGEVKQLVHQLTENAYLNHVDINALDEFFEYKIRGDEETYIEDQLDRAWEKSDHNEDKYAVAAHEVDDKRRKLNLLFIVLKARSRSLLNQGDHRARTQELNQFMSNTILAMKDQELEFQSQIEAVGTMIASQITQTTERRSQDGEYLEELVISQLANTENIGQSIDIPQGSYPIYESLQEVLSKNPAMSAHFKLGERFDSQGYYFSATALNRTGADIFKVVAAQLEIH